MKHSQRPPLVPATQLQSTSLRRTVWRMEHSRKPHLAHVIQLCWQKVRLSSSTLRPPWRDWLAVRRIH
eukprot:586284-Pelagomonas_calceolata.AAC.1